MFGVEQSWWKGAATVRAIERKLSLPAVRTCLTLILVIYSLTMTGTGALDPERRRYPRVKIHIPVELNCAGAAPMRAATDEVSLCGCYVETMFTMQIGTKLAVALSLGDDVVKCTAVVATKYPQVGNGIDFIDMTPEDRLKLNHHIAEHGESEGDPEGDE